MTPIHSGSIHFGKQVQPQQYPVFKQMIAQVFPQAQVINPNLCFIQHSTPGFKNLGQQLSEMRADEKTMSAVLKAGHVPQDVFTLTFNTIPKEFEGELATRRWMGENAEGKMLNSTTALIWQKNATA